MQRHSWSHADEARRRASAERCGRRGVVRCALSETEMSESCAEQPAPSAADHADGSVVAGRPDSMSADVFVAALLTYASDAIAVSDRDSGRFLVVSDSYCALTGYARDELIGRTSIELGLVADHAVRSEALGAADHELGAIRELRIRRKDGEIRLFEFSVQLLAGGLMLTISRDVTERRQIEQQLQESEERFRLLAENSRDVIRLYDADATIRYASPSSVAVLGYAPQELIGHHATEFQHPDDAASRKGRQEAVAAANGEVTVTYRSRHKDGGYVWLESSVRALRVEPGGAVTGFQEAARDISDRKQAEQALRAAEERYRDLFENSPTGIARVAVDGTPLAVNPAWASLMGYDSPEQFTTEVASTGELYVDPADREAMAQAVLEHGAARGLEVRLRRRDGTMVWVALDVSTATNADGEVVGLQGSGVDITERKRVEEALRDSEERFRLLAENSSDVINRISPDGTWRYASPSCRSLYGYDPEEMIGRSGWWKIHPNDHASVRDDAEAFMAGSDETATHEFRVRRKDGSYVWVESKARRLRDPVSGETIEFQSATRDITDRKAADGEIRRAKDEAEAANRAKSEFLSRMSHELRTPLNAILGFGQLLERAPLQERQHRHAEHVVKGGRHLLTLIDEVLEISRIESGNLGVSVEPVPLATSVQDALELIKPIADQRDIRIDSDISATVDLHVMADAQRLKQVLLNLLSNAVKYNTPGGRIRVFASLEGETLLLQVSDTGPGIAAEDLRRLFTPFDRLGAEASDVEGTGLGLALSRGLAEAMGGSLNATSEVGAGSTFELRLTRGEPTASSPNRTASDKDRPNVPACRVLYVEDNISNVRLIEEILADDDVEVIAAATGRLALDIAPGARADVILLDVNLPDMTGDEVLRGIRAYPETAATPVIVLTADATPATRRRMLKLGASAHLTKPIDIELLKTTLADNTIIPTSRPTDGHKTGPT
jgi:PAS domain S-box-containing protein